MKKLALALGAIFLASIGLQLLAERLDLVGSHAQAASDPDPEWIGSNGLGF